MKMFAGAHSEARNIGRARHGGVHRAELHDGRIGRLRVRHAIALGERSIPTTDRNTGTSCLVNRPFPHPMSMIGKEVSRCVRMTRR